LKPETVALMHSRAMTRDPALNGHALGFMETVINGQRIVGHSGDTLRYHNALSLLPEAQWGLFVSVNTGGARESISDGGARRFCDSELLEFARIPLQLIRYSSRHEIFVALDSCSPS
jgi:hypothetical protein